MKTFIYCLLLLYLLYYGANVLYDLYFKKARENKGSFFEETEFVIGDEFYALASEDSGTQELHSLEKESPIKNEEISNERTLEKEEETNSLSMEEVTSSERDNSDRSLSTAEENPSKENQDLSLEPESKSKKDQNPSSSVESLALSQEASRATPSVGPEASSLGSELKQAKTTETEDPRERIARLFPELEYEKESQGLVKEDSFEPVARKVHAKEKSFSEDLGKDKTESSIDEKLIKEWSTKLELAQTSIAIESHEGIKVFQSTLTPTPKRINLKNP